MQNVKVFDIKERCSIFSLDTIKFLGTLSDHYISRTMGKQLLRSATSIGANIVEAQSSPSRKDFTNFYSISLKSANETKYWLTLFGRSKIGCMQEVEKLQEEVNEISKIIGKSILTLKGK